MTIPFCSCIKCKLRHHRQRQIIPIAAFVVRLVGRNALGNSLEGWDMWSDLQDLTPFGDTLPLLVTQILAPSGAFRRCVSGLTVQLRFAQDLIIGTFPGILPSGHHHIA